MTHGDLQRMLQIMEDPGERAEPLLEFAGRESKRSCPACNTTMKIVFVAGEELDECNKHGVWFDQAELGRVLYRFMNGDSDA